VTCCAVVYYVTRVVFSRVGFKFFRLTHVRARDYRAGRKEIFTRANHNSAIGSGEWFMGSGVLHDQTEIFHSFTMCTR